MKIILILLILINIYKSYCSEFEINKQIKEPVITNVTSALILHQDDTSPYLNVYVRGIFPQSKKMNLTVFLNDEIIKVFEYQHDNSKNSSNPSPDSIIFKLYREGIVPGNITLKYSDTEIKSNSMELKLESYVYYTKNPDVTGGILTLNGFYYYVNYSSSPVVTIGNNSKSCEVFQYDNGFIKCLVDSSKVNNGDLISISNVYNYQNQSLEFQFNSPVIDRVLNVNRQQESQITLVGNNFNEKDSDQFEIYIQEASNRKRLCSKPVLVTNSVIICNLNKSNYQTLKGDTIYLQIQKSINNALQPQTITTTLAEFNLISIENKQDINNNNNSNGSITSNKYLLLAIILPTIIVFIFTIVLIIFIFKKKNQNSYFNLMNCSNELQETSYY